MQTSMGKPKKRILYVASIWIKFVFDRWSIRWRVDHTIMNFWLSFSAPTIKALWGASGAPFGNIFSISKKRLSIVGCFNSPFFFLTWAIKFFICWCVGTAFESFVIYFKFYKWRYKFLHTSISRFRIWAGVFPSWLWKRFIKILISAVSFRCPSSGVFSFGKWVCVPSDISAVIRFDLWDRNICNIIVHL